MDWSRIPADAGGFLYRHGPVNIPLIVSVILAFFLIVADLQFYGILGPLPCRASKNCSAVDPRPSVKLMMQDHMCHYVHHSSAEAFEDATHISRLPFVSPNSITTLHILVGMLGGYLVGSENLKVRQLAIGIFQFRLFLDLLDGAVFRRQLHFTMYVNGWGTMGYYYDAAADIIASLCLLYGLYTLLTRYRQPRRGDPALPTRQTDGQAADQLISRSAIGFTLWMCFFQGLARGGCWDNYARQFHSMLGKVLTNKADAALQAQIFNSPLTRFVLYLWKFTSAEGMLGFIYLGVFLDYTWPILVIVKKYGWIQLIIVVVITQLHSWQVSQLLANAH